MLRQIPESDWKLFRQLQEVALERFCQRVLLELGEISNNPHGSFHERYLTAYRLMRERDRELARAFDAPRRSQAMLQLAIIVGSGLLEPHELARFTKDTREVVTMLTTDGVSAQGHS